MPVDYVWPETSVNITNLPLSDPLCANKTCLAFKTAAAASQTQISWASQFWYGYYVSMFYGVILAGFSLVYFANRLHAFHASRSPTTFSPSDAPSSGDKVAAWVRSLSYRRATGWIARAIVLPSLGMAALVGVSCLFAVLVSFVQHPYYRENRGYGSPPLGVRAGLAGTALTPITIALSGKYNLVTLLTGISHEKLNFMHRWCGMIYLFFGIVHTVPFLVNDYASGGVKRLYYQFYYAGSMEYTGIPALAVLVFLGAFSNPWFRNLSYELFVHSHIAASIAFLGLMFWHSAQELDSWIYLWFTVAIWSVQLIARAWDKTAMFEWSTEKRRTGKADVQLLDDEVGEATMMRLTIRTALDWNPGEHVFLRFPKLGILDNHPFTLASVPEWTLGDGYGNSNANAMLFLVRPCKGVTSRLLRQLTNQDPIATAQEDTASEEDVRVKAIGQQDVRIEGPYGGSPQHQALNQMFDHVILVAGGGGISAMLPWLMRLAGQIVDYEKACRVQQVHLIWCMRHLSAASWVKEELQDCIRLGGDRVKVDIFVTGECSSGDVGSGLLAMTSSKEGSFTEHDGDKPSYELETLSAKSQASDDQWGVQFGRPTLQTVLPPLVKSKRTMIMGCGPESLKIDLSNVAASLQSRVLDNSVDEVALFTETFGW